MLKNGKSGPDLGLDFGRKTGISGGVAGGPPGGSGRPDLAKGGVQSYNAQLCTVRYIHNRGPRAQDLGPRGAPGQDLGISGQDRVKSGFFLKKRRKKAKKGSKMAKKGRKRALFLVFGGVSGSSWSFFPELAISLGKMGAPGSSGHFWAFLGILWVFSLDFGKKL